MIKSMTGFGRSEHSDGKRNITVEIKSVNHRYGDISVKMPRRYSFAEEMIKNIVKRTGGSLRGDSRWDSWWIRLWRAGWYHKNKWLRIHSSWLCKSRGCKRWAWSAPRIRRLWHNRWLLPWKAWPPAWKKWNNHHWWQYPSPHRGCW